MEPSARVRTQRSTVGEEFIEVRGVNQEVEGVLRRLRGAAVLETSDEILEADEIDYNSVTGDAEARGNVRYRSYTTDDRVNCDRAEYNLKSQLGKFYNVKGTSPAKIDARPGILVSPNPFAFEGKWAERIRDHYILHQGFVTSCKLPNPWWILRGSRFKITPGKSAVVQNAIYRLGPVPIFYFPYFHKSLERRPRKSGFLTPNFGNSTRNGFVYALGYYWAINRSYDLMYRPIFFTQRGLAHNVDFRGKPRQGSDFDMYIWGLNDRGRPLDDGRRFKAGGYRLNFTGRSILGKGWYAVGQVNYLSSFRFQQEFTQTFTEAVASELNSVGVVAKQWSTFSIHGVFARQVNYQSAEDNDRIVIRRLPQVEFTSRDREITPAGSKLPVWVSFESAAGFVRRNQPLFQTRQFVERMDAAPRVTSRLRWKELTLLPYFGVRGSYWGSSRPEVAGQITGTNLTRFAREAGADLMLPSLARIFDAPGWMGGGKLKHVIEPRASFRHVSGVADFNRIIRFDDIELLTNTSEAEISVANRFYVKDRGGVTKEYLSWTVWQRRYFDPTLGGALNEDRRNVVLTQMQLTPYAFFDRPRNYSPIVSAVRISPLRTLDVEWRADYDPLRGGITNSGFMAQGRIQNFLVTAGHNQVKSLDTLSPPANQFSGMIGWGDSNRKGLSAGFFANYDYRIGRMQFNQSQVTYNSDCCGLSVQFRRFNFGTRNENQWRVAFVIANIGSFGTLRRQERFF